MRLLGGIFRRIGVPTVPSSGVKTTNPTCIPDISNVVFCVFSFLFFFPSYPLSRYSLSLFYCTSILRYSTLYTIGSHDLISNKRVSPIALRTVHDECNTRTIQSNAQLWNSIFLSGDQTFTFLVVLIPYFTHQRFFVDLERFVSTNRIRSQQLIASSPFFLFCFIRPKLFYHTFNDIRFYHFRILFIFEAYFIAFEDFGIWSRINNEIFSFLKKKK